MYEHLNWYEISIVTIIQGEILHAWLLGFSIMSAKVVRETKKTR